MTEFRQNKFYFFITNLNNNKKILEMKVLGIEIEVMKN